MVRSFTEMDTGWELCSSSKYARQSCAPAPAAPPVRGHKTASNEKAGRLDMHRDIVLLIDQVSENLVFYPFRPNNKLRRSARHSAPPSSFTPSAVTRSMAMRLSDGGIMRAY